MQIRTKTINKQKGFVFVLGKNVKSLYNPSYLLCAFGPKKNPFVLSGDQNLLEITKALRDSFGFHKARLDKLIKLVTFGTEEFRSILRSHHK